jgi:hypothetical protein
VGETVAVGEVIKENSDFKQNELQSYSGHAGLLATLSPESSKAFAWLARLPPRPQLANKELHEA